jgi:hypothetical protein
MIVFRIEISDTDLTVLGLSFWSMLSPRCKQVRVIVGANKLIRLGGRNPPTKYKDRTRTTEFLKHLQTMLAVVNATCEIMVMVIDEEECDVQRCHNSRTMFFEQFRKEFSYLIPKTMPVKDIPYPLLRCCLPT